MMAQRSCFQRNNCRRFTSKKLGVWKQTAHECMRSTKTISPNTQTCNEGITQLLRTPEGRHVMVRAE